MDYSQIITIDPERRSGKRCIRGTRMTEYDVLGYMAAGMSHQEILADFPSLTEADLLACLAFAADGEWGYEVVLTWSCSSARTSDHAAVHPPSMVNSDPLINAASREARYRTIDATSSGWPRRPIGCRAFSSSRIFSFSCAWYLSR